MAIHISHKLGFSARLNMKVASWGYLCFSVRFFREPAAQFGETAVVVPDLSGSEFEVGRPSSHDDVATLYERSPMGYRSSLYHFSTFCGNVREILMMFGIP